MATKAKYRGRVDREGVPLDFYSGVPARDLDDDDYEALNAEQKRLVRYGDLYDVKPSAESNPAAKPKASVEKVEPPVAPEPSTVVEGSVG